MPWVGRLLTLADQIPVVAGQGRKALNAARAKLAQGHTIAIFPEGRLSPSKGCRRFGVGAVLLALQSGAPLVPVGFFVPPEFVRTLRARVRGREAAGRWQIGGRCFVRIGEPWRVTLGAEKNPSYRLLRDLTESLSARIAALVQQAEMEGRG
jgi:1-acyl-sn-glycerol-3-phosphate acyltransferase